MIEHRLRESFQAEDLGWIRFKSHFPYPPTPGPDGASWGALCVLGDDEIAPGTGFPLHPHQNMEIVTYVIEGALTHRDDQGNEGRIEAGDVQVMSAGTGIRHSEYNREDNVARLFQIWIRPEEMGGRPTWGIKPFPRDDRAGGFVVLASGLPNDGDVLPMRAAARVAGAAVARGDIVSYALAPGRKAYLIVASGTLNIAGRNARSGDSVAIRDESGFAVVGVTDGEVVLVELA